MHRGFLTLLDALSALVSAALIVLAFPPFGFAPLIWLALVPWLLRLRQARGAPQALLQGLLLAWITSAAAYSWTLPGMKAWFGISLPSALLLHLVFSLFYQWQFAAFAVLFWFVTARLERGPAVVRILALSLGYCAIEWMFYKPTGDTLGGVFYLSPWLRQLADLGGVPLLTFLVIFVNGSIAGILEDWRKGPGRQPRGIRIAPAIAATLLVAAALTYGRWRSSEIGSATGEAKRTLRVAAIQGNLDPVEKDAALSGDVKAVSHYIDTYTALSREALGSVPLPDLIVWPETAFPYYYGSSRAEPYLSAERAIDTLIAGTATSFVFGSFLLEGEKIYNGLVFTSPKAQAGRPFTLQTYRKSLLVPFAESSPFPDFLKSLFPWLSQSRGYSAGPGPQIVELKTDRLGSVRIAPSICYELLFAGYIAGAAEKGADLILNVANDSWFQSAGEQALHLGLSVFRAIETRRPVIRSTENGATVLVLPDGSITTRSVSNQREVLTMKVPLAEIAATPFIRWGSWFGPFSLIAGGILMF